MNDKVVPFTVVISNSDEAVEILNACKWAGFSEIVVIGVDDEGSVEVCNTTMTRERINLLLDKAKIQVLTDED